MAPHESQLDCENFNDDNGNPAGGYAKGPGFSIDWQNGPLVDPETGDRREQTGAFVEDVLRAVIQRVEYYQDSRFNSAYNENALTAMREALSQFNARTADREDRGVEGTHQE